MNRTQLNKLLEKVNYRLMHLGLPEGAENVDFSNHKEIHKGLNPRDFGIDEWDWPQGVGLYGLLELQRARGNQDYDEFLIDWVRKNLERGLPSRNINTTAPFLVLLDLIERHDFPEWEEQCKIHADWLINDLPKTKDGGFQHVTTGIPDRNAVILNEGQLWDDTLFMAVLFLGKIGVRYNNRTWIEESVHQFLVHIQYLYERETGLFYHGWTFNGNNNFGRIFWNRGNSWFTYGCIAYLEAIGDNIGSAVKTYILDVWKHQVDALKELQNESGLWPTVLDDPDSYEEASGSAAIAAGILLGIRSGLLDPSYTEMGMKAVEGIIDCIAEDGTVQKVSSGTSMGMDEQHYLDIVIRPMAYGQSLTSLALTQAYYLVG